MNMNRETHVNLIFHGSMLVDRRKEWDSYKMKVVIKKSERHLLKISCLKWNSLAWKWSSYFWICLWNNGPWMTIPRIPKNPPYVGSNYSSLEFEIFQRAQAKQDQKFGIWAPEMPIMKNMDFVIGTLYEVKAELGAPSSSSVPIWPWHKGIGGNFVWPGRQGCNGE